MSIEVNNPGVGDCGFYAFAIGLIANIQDEYRTSKSSTTFNRWCTLGLDKKYLPELLTLDLHKLKQNPQHYEKKLLASLQMSLRHSLVSLNQAALESSITHPQHLKSTLLYGKINQLVDLYLQENPAQKKLQALSQFNELALSPVCLTRIQQLAHTIKEQWQKSAPYLKEQVQDQCISQFIQGDLCAQSTTDSVILTAAKKIGTQGYWATHSDLKTLAEHFKVNLNICDVNVGVLDPTRPTITLKNHHNAHWTTIIPSLALVMDKQSAPSASSDSTATQQLTKKPSQKAATSLGQTPTAGLNKNYSVIEQRIISTTLSAQLTKKHLPAYEHHLTQLLQCAKDLKFFAQANNNKIAIQQLNNAQALPGESDHDFAVRLQEAELRRVQVI